MPQGSTTSWSYILIRLLFKFVLKIFYGTIVVENAELIPKTGQPCIVCANHPNCLTDALLLVTSMPSKTRNMLRLTAKSTQFGHRTFTSWLVESAGTVPIKRRKDFNGNQVDNSQAMDKLMEALELGDAVCLFPEGASRYHPTIAPLKTGVARILSDVLSRNRDDPNFSVSILTCSVTYMHRQHFRSDVLVTFNPPMTFTPKDNPELLAPVQYEEIKAVTARMQQQISSRTIDSPSWEIVRSAKMATRIYAPLGTLMSLGDYVRVTRTFVEAFKASDDSQKSERSAEDQSVDFTREDAEFSQLRRDLKDYQDQLVYWGIKDDRITHPLSRRTVIMRMVIRLAWSICLSIISFPGLVLWTPVFATTYIAVRNFKKTGPIWNTWDEIAQRKLVYGLFSGLSVWAACILLTLPTAAITCFLVPALMWMTLRWMEDAVSAFRAFMALARLLGVGKKTLNKIRTTRRDLHARLMNLAVGTLGLPDDPERFFVESGGKQKGRVRSKWDSGAKYFSVRRRRKRDWNETLRLYDQVDYPEEGL
ncbi:hypothetical protein K503DRAFT_864905 [Rhizopogon vinicolor AM-OR11-026]|uniref:Phospholipid/glycerol acyltransferase domain-containing protein n=1 Tax=Rhizopogon vinicolor AM-OR11-026 TaxID=1314800 RepID=A0A1B7N5L5_9AGAM|nr:hypothetical protein K503DRAFT_864905 [Rhizopogon vinicolor AM-OR11-026]